MLLRMERYMLRDRTWQAADTVTRAQLALFEALGDLISLTEDDRRRALNLDYDTWLAWQDFLSDGHLPSEPPLPDMLLRLGESAFSILTVAEARQISA